jgi:hypothetical protein
MEATQEQASFVGPRGLAVQFALLHRKEDTSRRLEGMAGRYLNAMRLLRVHFEGMGG